MRSLRPIKHLTLNWETWRVECMFFSFNEELNLLVTTLTLVCSLSTSQSFDFPSVPSRFSPEHRDLTVCVLSFHFTLNVVCETPPRPRHPPPPLTHFQLQTH